MPTFYILFKNWPCRLLILTSIIFLCVVDSAKAQTLSSPVDNDATGNYVAANAPASTTVGVTASSTASGYTGVNIALNKATSESGYQFDLFTDYSSSQAVDGNTGTRFSSNFSNTAWMTIDLGATYNITGVKLLWEAAYGKGYKIQTSANNSTWTDIYSTTTGDGNTDDLTTGQATGTGRYIRMQGVTRGNALYGYSLYEFQVFGAPAAVTYSLTTNPSGIFQINSSTGVISVLSGTSLNGGVYTVQVTASAGSLTAATNFTINAVGAPTVPAVTKCGAGAITITASNTPTGGTYNWYTKATGGTLLQSSTSTTYTPTLVTSATYYVSYTLGGITSSRTSVTATINPIVSSPVSNATFSYSFTGNTKDVSGKQNDGIVVNAPTAVADRYGVASTAYSFNGTSQWMETTTQVTDPQTFSISVWFNTTTTTGGKIIGFTGSQTGGGQYDRHLYMTDAGLLYFGVYSSGFNTVNTTTAYNDGLWHHAVVTLSATNGMKLYVDNTLQASNAGYTSAEPHDGYWGIGGATANNIGGWPSSPTSTYFNGTIDDVAIYSTELSAATVTSLNDINQIGAYAPVCVGSPLTIYCPTITGATYSWTDPVGTTATGQNPTFATAVAGTYTLTVTGGPGGCSSTATYVPTINALPVATFSIAANVDINTTTPVTYTGTYNAALTYAWTFTGGAPSTGTGGGPFAVQWATTGTKSVSLTVTNPATGCSATSTQTILVGTFGGYALSKPLVLNTSAITGGITSTLTNFPALVYVQDNALKIGNVCADKVQFPLGNGGGLTNGTNYDFAFTLAGTTTELNYQVDTYDAVNGILLAWVKIPSLTSTNTNLTFYFGSLTPAHTAATAAATWASDYLAVYHFSEGSATATVLDATGNGRNATQTNTSISNDEIHVAASIPVTGGGYSFNGSSTKIVQSAGTNPVISGAFTLSAWVYYNGANTSDNKIMSNELNYGSGYKLSVKSGNVESETRTNANPSNAYLLNTGGVSSGSWTYIQGVYDGTKFTNYVNGVASSTTATASAPGTGNVINLGVDYLSTTTATNFYNGYMDEPRISNVAKSSDWIRAEYYNQKNPLTFTNFSGSLTAYQSNATSLKGALTYTWTGATSTDPTVNTNWTNTTTTIANQLPDFTGGATLVIPSGLARYPTLTANASIYGLTIASGASLNLNGKVLSVGCNIYNSSGGQILYNSNNASGITWNGASSTQTYTGANTINTAQIGNMIINNSAGGTITMGSGPIDIYNSLTITKGNLAVSASPAVLTLKSTSTQSAYVDIIPSTYSISGNVNVERFITGGSSAYRSYRLLSSPVNISSSIAGTGNLGLSYLNTTPTIPTGSTSYGALTGGPSGAANGFTVSNNNPTIYLYNESRRTDNFTFTSGKTIGVIQIGATDVTTLTSYTSTANVTIPVGNGYMLYYIGDNRTTTTASSRVPESATITAIGYLNQGTIPVKIWNTGSTNLSYASVANPGYNLLGNPYACTIDLNKVYTDNGSVTPNFYELNNQNPNQNYLNYNAPTGATSGNPRASRYIASGQGFIIKATGASQTFNFKEDQKVTTQLSATGANNFILLESVPKAEVLSNTNLSPKVGNVKNMSAFNAQDESSKLIGLHMQLSKDSVYNDACGIYFREDWSDDFDDNDAMDLDGMASKVFMSSFTSDGQRTAINFLSDYRTGKRVKLFVKAATDGMYNLTMTDIQNIDTLQYKIGLIDHYKKDSLDIGSYKTYAFNVLKADTTTFGADRFELVISKLQTSKYQLATFTAQKASDGVLVTWRAYNEDKNYAFTLEKQDANGTFFTPVYEIQSNGGTIYKYTDKTPNNGNNVYRLKQVDLFGNITYAGPVSIYYDQSGTESMFTLYPNPTVETLHVNVTYGKTNNTTAKYNLKIYDISGSVVMQKTSDATSWTENVSKFNPGVYIVELRNNDGSSLGKAKFVKK
jgi:hypothetical protein